MWEYGRGSVKQARSADSQSTIDGASYGPRPLRTALVKSSLVNEDSVIIFPRSERQTLWIGRNFRGG